MVGKAMRSLFGKAKRAFVPLELVHSDICGPMNVRTRHGAQYFITFIDDFTQFDHVYLISHRFEALDCFKRYSILVKNQLNKKTKSYGLIEDMNIYLAYLKHIVMKRVQVDN